MSKPRPISKTDLNHLPVAPEFVEALEELAAKTAWNYLEATGAPQELIDCVNSISNLGYYLTACYRDPEGFMGDAADRYGIEEIVIEAVNAIAKLGGEFSGPYGGYRPRAGTVLAEVEAKEG